MAGICGSDLARVSQANPPDREHEPPAGQPLELGHEIVGVVAGSARGGPAPGTRVAVHPLVTCEARDIEPCPSCREGWYGQCRSFWERPRWGKSIGMSSGLGGGWGDFVAVHRCMLRPLPDGLDDRAAVLAEPLSVALSGIELVRSAPGDQVAVVGGGTLGLLTAVAVARQFPERSCYLIARHTFQVSAARALGLGLVEPLRAQPLADAMAVLGLKVVDLGGSAMALDGPELVVDAAGTPEALSEALALVGVGGKVLTLGNPEGCLDLRALWLKRVTLIGHLEHARVTTEESRVDSMTEAVRLLAEWPCLGDLLVTHIFALDTFERAVAVAVDRASRRAIKVALVP